jgi:hypothetical protein
MGKGEAPLAFEVCFTVRCSNYRSRVELCLLKMPYFEGGRPRFLEPGRTLLMEYPSSKIGAKLLIQSF